MSLGEKSLYPQIDILQDALKSNLDLISNLVLDSTKILIPVKANAYGCGLEQIIPFLESCKRVEYVGVANPREGAIVRSLGYSKKILLLGSFFRDSLDEIIFNKIIITVTDVEQIEYLEQFAKEHAICLDIHLKCDVGMGRLGITRDKVDESIYYLKNAQHLKIAGLYTHFPSAEKESSTEMYQQIKDFDELFEIYIQELGLERLAVLKHAANSQACMQYTQTHYDMVRTGLMFYGYFSTMIEKKQQEAKVKLSPCIELYASPISLRVLHKGDSVSYGSTFTVQKDTLPVGVFPLGYADGINRKLANKITFGGYPLIGNVTMDQVILSGISLNKRIQFLGENSFCLEHWADLSQTTTYELLTHLGERLKRVLV